LLADVHPNIVWSWDPVPLIPVALYAYLYTRRFITVRRETGGRGASWWQAAAAVACVLVLLAALVSPIDRLGEDYLFSMHMVQHILLGDIAPLLVLLSLSRVMMRPLTRRLTSIERALGPFAHPATGIAVWLFFIYIWHIPAMYDAALRHSGIHALEHICFFTGGIALWWPLIQPVPMRRRLTGLGILAYLLVAKISVSALGIALTWSHGAAYSYYEHVPRIWGLTAASDQNVGGAIMMVEQSVLLVSVLAVLFGRMLAQSEQDELRRERLEERAAAG
jgi:cytochrome c oxidase assembly factor CtaG